MYYDHVKMREVSLNHGDSIEHGITVSNDFQCRSCESHTLMLQHALLANKCVHTSAAEACKCVRVFVCLRVWWLVDRRMSARGIRDDYVLLCTS